MLNLIPIWVDPNNKVRQLIQMSKLINLKLIGKMIMTLWQSTVIINNKVRQLIQMLNLINLNLIGKMIMALWQLAVIAHQNGGKNVERQIVKMKSLFFLQVQ